VCQDVVVPADSRVRRTREEILSVAARLFAERGYAATSTRLIADAVGIRQASLYYHFPSKEAVLAELLASTVRPSLELCRDLEAADLAPAEALRRLVTFDVGVLLRVEGNVGLLYALPEVGTDPFSTFRTERAELRDAYARLATAALAPGVHPVTADLVLGLVESVIPLRRDSPKLPPPDEVGEALAAAALRMLGAG